jgi:integrase
MTFAFKGEAQEWLKLKRAKLQRTVTGDVFSGSAVDYSLEVLDYVERHISLQTNHLGALLAPSTQELYRRLAKVHLSRFAGTLITEIQKPDIDLWWAQMLETGKKTTASKAYKLLSAALSRAVEDDVILKNPCRVKGAQSAVTGRKAVSPSSRQVTLLMYAIRPRFRYFVPLVAYTGLRFGEATELRRKDVVPALRKGNKAFNINVSRAVTFVGGRFIVGRPKSMKSNRTIELTDELTPIVHAILDQIPDHPEALLFPNPTGKHQRHDVFMVAWNAAIKKAGLTEVRFTPHGLRHHAASAYAKTGANLPEIMRWLGDNNVSAAERYLHVTDRADELAFKMTVDEAILQEELLERVWVDPISLLENKSSKA